MKSYLILFSSLFIACFAKAQRAEFKDDKFVIAAYGNYVQDNLRWSIAGNSNGQNPNILSEVHWKNLKLRGAGLDVQVNIWSGIIFKGQFMRNTIYSGSAADTDYSADNRTNPTYQASLNCDQGYSLHYAAALGYRLKLLPALAVTPYAGYHKSRQLLWLEQFNDESPAEQKKLNSTYQTNWAGPMIGFDVALAINEWLNMKTKLSYAQIKYLAEADWNLIDAFAHPVSFRHTADGYDAMLVLQADFRIISPLSAFIRVNYTHGATGTGIDKLFLVDGQTLKSQFNEVVRNSRGAGIGICYHF